MTAYTGIQNKAYSAAIMSDANQWDKVFHSYKAINGSYPLKSDPNNGTCVPLGQSQCDFTKTTASRYNNFYQGPIDRSKSVVDSLPKGGQPGAQADPIGMGLYKDTILALRTALRKYSF